MYMHHHLDDSGSNAEQQSDEEKQDEGEGCVPHVVMFRFHGIVPLAVGLNQELWMCSNTDVKT